MIAAVFCYTSILFNSSRASRIIAIAVLPDEIIVFMDFGMIGRLNPEMKTHFASLVISMMRQNTDGVIKAITRMGLVPDEVNMQLLRTDIDFIKDKYYDVPLSQVSLGEAINELL